MTISNLTTTRWPKTNWPVTERFPLVSRSLDWAYSIFWLYMMKPSCVATLS